MFCEVTFRLESKVANVALIRSHISVSADVLLQHAGFLASDATFFTDVLATASTTDNTKATAGAQPRQHCPLRLPGKCGPRPRNPGHGHTLAVGWHDHGFSAITVARSECKAALYS